MGVLLAVSANFPDNPRIHHFKSDVINNMDHMRISGTEPPSAIFSQKGIFKTFQNKLKPKGMV